MHWILIKLQVFGILDFFDLHWPSLAFMTFFGLSWFFKAKIGVLMSKSDAIDVLFIPRHWKQFSYQNHQSGLQCRPYKKHYIWHFSQSTLYIGKNISREIVKSRLSNFIYRTRSYLPHNSKLKARKRPAISECKLRLKKVVIDKI